MGVPLQNRPEKVREQISSGEKGKKGGLKGAFPEHDRKNRGVVSDEQIMLRGRSDDAQLSAL